MVLKKSIKQQKEIQKKWIIETCNPKDCNIKKDAKVI